MVQRTAVLKGTSAPATRRRGVPGWLLTTPAVILLAAMTIVPGLYVLYASVQRYTLLSSTGPRFVGLDNYAFILTDPANRQSLANTVFFIVATVTIEVLVGLVLALALARRTIGNTIATALLILPFAVTPSVSALLWQMLLNPLYGWFDYYAQRLHLMGTPVAWLSNPGTAWAAVIGLDAWLATPFVTLVLLAGLQGLPTELNEAASVDGANGWQRFWHITLPLLRPALAIAVVLRVVDASKVFTTIFVLTGGGPAGSTRVISLAIFQIGLKDFNIGLAAAFCTLFLLVLSIVVPLMLRVLTRNTEMAES